MICRLFVLNSCSICPLQRMFVEMEQMASRPFSTVNVEVEYSYESYIADKIELLPPDTRKRAKKVSIVICIRVDYHGNPGQSSR